MARSKKRCKLRTVRLVEVVMDAPARSAKPIRGPDDVEAVVRPLLENCDREKFIRVDLNARHEVIALEIVSVGALNVSIVHPREVFKGAILNNAAAIIVAHNHPSGDPEPSEEDLGITTKLKEVGELLGIQLLDHVIVAGRKLVSFRSRNHL